VNPPSSNINGTSPVSSSPKIIDSVSSDHSIELQSDTNVLSTQTSHISQSMDGQSSEHTSSQQHGEPETQMVNKYINTQHTFIGYYYELYI
jgi:hypothetical protein